MNGIAYIQEFKIFVSPKCENTIFELGSYRWKKDKYENGINVPEDSDNHLCDALRYAMYDVRFFKPQDPKLKRKTQYEPRYTYASGIRSEDINGRWGG